MTQLTHDPYLNTVKRNLQDKYYKEHHKKSKAQEATKSHDFLRQNFDLHEHINLPEGIEQLFMFTAFLLVPYTIGILFVFVLITGVHLKIIEHITLEDFPMFWAIGYEIIASLILILIFKSAINFKNTQTIHT